MTEALNPTNPVLMVDDEKYVLMSFDTELRSAGITNLIACQDAREALPLAAGQEIEVMLLDLSMPHVSGQELLARMTSDHPEVPVIVVTGNDEVETAVSCMKAGAFDYITKPLEEGLLAACVNRAIRFRELNREVGLLRDKIFSDSLDHPEAFSDILAASESMRTVFQYVEAVAKTSQPVLITGETGVGKELIARAVHQVSGRPGPFIAVNVAGLDDNVFADTLFGHRRGAFTGADQVRKGVVEQASKGTLFLDEIGDLDPASQVKMLRLVEEREYLPLGEDIPRRSHARIVVATNQDLVAAQQEGRFRKDLYYRLRTHHVHIPPLRERREDLPLLVDKFLDEAAEALGKKKPTPPKELFTLLATYSFPGNVRELKAMIYDAVSGHQAGVMSLAPFKVYLGRDGQAPAGPSGSAAPALEPFFAEWDELPTLKEAAELLTAEAMKRAKGNITVAAEMLGVTRQALSKRLKRSAEG